MTIVLPHGRVATTPLGFGTAYLTGGLEARGNRRLVDAALDAGIRHFDTAPLYGLGLAEDVLGEALASRRDHVTIASKVGVGRPQVPLHIRLARRFAGPLRRHVGRWIRAMGRGAHAPTRSRGVFDVPRVAASLDESLRRLRTDYLDLLLLHEVWPEDVTDELLTFLDKQRDVGRCLAFGTATSLEDELRVLTAHEDVFDVGQHSWSPLDPPLPADAPTARMTITHRAVLRALEPLQAWFREDPAAKKALAEASGVDLDHPDTLPQLLLGAALAANPGGITLVATRRADRVRANARVLQAPEFVTAGAHFTEALRARPDFPPPRE